MSIIFIAHMIIIQTFSRPLIELGATKNNLSLEKKYSSNSYLKITSQKSESFFLNSEIEINKDKLFLEWQKTIVDFSLPNEINHYQKKYSTNKFIFSKIAPINRSKKLKLKKSLVFEDLITAPGTLNELISGNQLKKKKYLKYQWEINITQRTFNPQTVNLNFLIGLKPIEVTKNLSNYHFETEGILKHEITAKHALFIGAQYKLEKTSEKNNTTIQRQLNYKLGYQLQF